MPTGYSGTPLVKKLGLKPSFRILLVNIPDHYFELLGELPEDLKIFSKVSGGSFDFIHLFVTDHNELLKELPELKSTLAKSGILWISWPKRSSSITTNLNRNIVQKEGLAAGLVDIKVCAVDEDWSGLKFVFRKKDR